MEWTPLHHRSYRRHGSRHHDPARRAQRAAPRLNHVVLLLLVLGLAACGGDEPAAPATPTVEELEAQADDVRAKAARWLWQQQARDGGWHSQTYGLLRSGQSLTPFVLGALLSVPEHLVPRNDNRVRQALAFMVSRVDERGALGLADDTVADYPTYATAMALPIFRRNLGRPALADRMRDRLLATQYRRKGGWPETHPAFGAWGMGVDVQPPNPGHLDLSMTRHALEALIFERGDSVKAARTRALRFVDRLRSPSGGWFFSTVLTDKNKAGPDEPDSFRGYGTTTADAWLAYLAAGVPRDDERMQAAAAWLVKHHEVARVPGLPEDDPWAASMRYYYRAVSARVFSELDLKEAPVGRDWRQDVIEAFVKEQRPDGSFVSAGKLMKEDDPLIATGLVLQALGALRY